MDGLEHKDERLRATEGPDWRDKLARLRDGLDAEDSSDSSEGDDDSRSAVGRGR